MKEKVYVDSNIFIYAATNIETEGERARALLEKIKNGDMQGVTSLLALDEVLWALQKATGKKVAHMVVSTLLIFPNLILVDVTRSILAETLHIYEHHNLHPRDALHLATMQLKGIKTILSSDPDFDRIPTVKRIGLR